MSNKKSTWLWTCGIGCGALVIVAVVAVVGVTLYFRNSFSGFSEAVDIKEEMEARFGDADDFVAPLGGVIPAERVEAFLRVRADTMPSRQAIADFFSKIPDRDRAEEMEDSSVWDQIRFALSMARGGLSLPSDLGEFFSQRNRSLLEQEMGMGEYTYIYCTAYYSWLKKSIDDGPGRTGTDVNVGDANFRRVRRIWIGSLQRSVESSAEAGEAPEQVVEELRRLQEDSQRIPWEDGIPAAIAENLEPFREDLENTYLALTNPFELVVTERNGRYSFSSKVGALRRRELMTPHVRNAFPTLRQGFGEQARAGGLGLR